MNNLVFTRFTCTIWSFVSGIVLILTVNFLYFMVKDFCNLKLYWRNLRDFESSNFLIATPPTTKISRIRIPYYSYLGTRCFLCIVMPLFKQYVWRKKPQLGTWFRGCFIYILDSSNSSSYTFGSSKLASSSRSNWTNMWNGSSNGCWPDKHSSHFSMAKEMSLKATFFFM